MIKRDKQLTKNNKQNLCLNHSPNHHTKPNPTPILLDAALQQSQRILRQYSQQILTYISDSSQNIFNFLSQHQITEQLRAKMVDWMVEVLSSYKMSEQTFFKAVMYMDLFLKKSLLRKQSKDIHLIGLCCMLIASKNQQVYAIKLKVLIDKIGMNKYTKSQIINAEAEIIKTLGFNTQVTTLYTYVKHLLHLLPFQKLSKEYEYLLSVTTYLTKMTRYHYKLSEYPVPFLSVSVLYVALKTVDQAFPIMNPQQNMRRFVQLLQINEDSLVDTSRQILQLAKSFSKVFPNLTNLNKFNQIQYPK